MSLCGAISVLVPLRESGRYDEKLALQCAATLAHSFPLGEPRFHLKADWL